MVSKPPVVSKAAVRRAHRYVKTLVVAFDWGYQAVLGPDTVTAQARRVADMPLSASPASDEVSRALLSLKRINQHMAVHGSGQRAIDSYYELAYELGVDPGDLDATVHWLKAGRRRIVESPPALAMSTEQAVAAAIAEMVRVDPDTLQSEVGGLVVTTSDQLEAVIAQQRKQAFDRWFGSSKVVDASGGPMVVYHGTRSNDIAVFIPGVDGAGWFAERPETASWFSGQGTDSTTYPVYLSLQNPLDTRTKEGSAIFRRLVDLDAEPSIAEQLGAHGYDGMISEEAPGHPTYLAFRPEQIKSAIGNRGTFDNTNPDILFSFADAEELVRNEPGIRFSCRPETGETYAARIDELFVGGKASLAGVRVLDRSDLLDLLGHGSKPVVLAEGKVIAGRASHPRMTAEVWKKVPLWLDDPAAVFVSETDGGLVFIAPESLHGTPVSIIVRPEAGHPSTLQAHLLLNAYDRSTATPFARWINDGLLRYVHKTKFPALLENTSGRQLPGTAFNNKPGTRAILTEKHLAGYRRANGDSVPLRAQAWHDASSNTTVFLADRIPVGREASVFLHEIVHRHGRAALSQGHFEQLVHQVRSWAQREPGTTERMIHDAAVQRVATARVTGAAADEELFAYAVEEAVARGVQPSAAAVTGSAEAWLQAVVESIQRIGERLIGNDLQGLDGQDLVDLAYALAQVERPEHAPVIEQALQEALQGAVPAPQQGRDDEGPAP